MKKTILTIIFAILAVVCIGWACSYQFSGLAWFPGFILAVFFCIRILEINQVGRAQ